MKNLIKALLLNVVLFFSYAVNANTFPILEWHSSNIEILRGENYQLGNKKRTILTFEHANGFKYGDFFMFGDYIWPDNAESTYYIEPTIRFSLNKITGYQFSNKFIKDTFLAFHIEKPKGQRIRKLAGIAVDFNISGFKFFKSHLFYRNNPNFSGSTHQVTLSWNYPFKVKGADFLIEGFADFTGKEGRASSYQIFVPRLLTDIGYMVGLQNNKLWAGIEWQYWHNKFGVDGVTESVPQLQLKYNI